MKTITIKEPVYEMVKKQIGERDKIVKELDDLDI